MKKMLVGLVSLLVLGFGCATPPPAPVVTAEPATALAEVRNVNVQPGQLITSPFVVTGEAEGSWFFEAVIGVAVYDAQGKRLDSQNYGQAKGDWMVTGFVPFESTLTFSVTPTTTATGYIEIHNDNASGLPEHDSLVRIPVRFK
jgi:hypothetical protein